MGTIPEGQIIQRLSRSHIGGYLCLWGDRSRKIAGEWDEWFSPDTAGLTSIYEEMGALPVLFHATGAGATTSIPIGLVDGMEFDDVGLWIEAQIKLRNEYEHMIEPLVEQQGLGWAPGTLPHACRVQRSTGKILRWPIVEASMTPAPVEWRKSIRWPVASLKAVYSAAGLGASHSRIERDLELLRLLTL